MSYYFEGTHRIVDWLDYVVAPAVVTGGNHTASKLEFAFTVAVCEDGWMRLAAAAFVADVQVSALITPFAFS